MATIKSAGAAHGTPAAAGSERGVVDVAIAGATGRVGRRVLELIDARRALLQRSGVRLRIVAAAMPVRSATSLIASPFTV